MKVITFVFSVFLILSCNSSARLTLPKRNNTSLTGNEFYKDVLTASRQERESLAKAEILNGNVPDFLRKMVRVNTSIINSEGKTINSWYYVSPDYLSIGSNEDFARIPITPSTAQLIANSLHCFLPTRKMVDDIYKASKVKLDPVPMYVFRDSAVPCTNITLS